MGGLFAAGQKLLDKTYDAMDRIHNTLIPRMIVTSERTNVVLESTNKLIEEAGTNIANASTVVTKAATIGAGFAAFKFCSDVGVSWYRAIKLTGIASDAKNAFKRLANNTSKTEDEVVNVLKNTSGDLKSSVGQFTEDVHKMGQNFGDMTESISQSSAEISGAANQASRNFGYMTQDFHQVSRCFMVTCLSLTTSTLVALAAYVTYLQESSCDRDKESMLCTVPLKSMAAAAIATGVVAIRMLTPNRVQHPVHQNSEIFTSNEATSASGHPDQTPLNKNTELNSFIPEEGFNQNFEWTEEKLNLIKATNVEVFIHIEKKIKFACSNWTKPELEWLSNKDPNIFLNVIASWSCSLSGHLNDKN